MSGSSIATFERRAVDLDGLVGAKRATTIAVVIPARDEEATVGAIVTSIRDALVEGVPLLDELVVVDDGSVDDTAALAEKAGATVVRIAARTEGVTGRGKGAAMGVGLEASASEVVVFLDADVTNFSPHFIVGLVGPLLTDAAIQLVKGFYERPALDPGAGGGRVTELVARPLISLLFPELDGIRQPLAGETAARRDALSSVELESGYGVEMGLLLDVAARFGTRALAQVDLGSRRHRNRPLAELAPQAREVMEAALRRRRER